MLLVVADTLRADRLGVYGAAGDNSPHIDRFAARAVVFDSALTTAPFTMPAVASLMTGLYPDRVGVSSHSSSDRIAGDAATLAELARTAGYGTAAIVTNPWLAKRRMGFARGFDLFVSGWSTGAGRARLEASEVTDRALAVLDSAPGGGPLLLWVHYMDTHMPYSPPAHFAEVAGASGAPSAVIEDFSAAGADRQRIYFEAPYDEGELEATRQLYDASVRYVDAEIGRLLDGLDARGMANETIVVVVADHGEALGDHGLHFAHDFTLYEELVRVPLLVRAPGVPPRRWPGQVSVLDVLPTLCALTPIACPRGLDGVALPGIVARTGADRSLFATSAPARRRYDRNPWLLLAGPEGRLAMLRRDGVKLIRVPAPGAARWEAYRLAEDPGELDNVYEVGRYADLAGELEAWLERMGSARAHGSSGRGGLGPRARAELRALGYLD